MSTCNEFLVTTADETRVNADTRLCLLQTQDYVYPEELASSQNIGVSIVLKVASESLFINAPNLFPA